MTGRSPWGCIVLDVVEGAEWCYFSVPNTPELLASPDLYAVLSYTDDITDVEPEWVHHKATLVGAFKTTSINGRSGSGAVKDNPLASVPTTGIPFDNHVNVLASRGLKVFSYDEYKNIINLVYVGRGSLQGYLWGELNWNGGRVKQGEALESGMSDITKNNNVWGFWKENGVSKEWIRCQTIKLMGYELLYAGLWNNLGGSLWFGDSTRQDGFFLRATRGDGATTQIVLCKSWETYVQRVRHEKYMDILGITPQGSSAGSKSTYYTGQTSIWGVSAERLPIAVGHYSSDAGVVYFRNNDDTRALNYLVVRTMYDGEIREVKSVQEFINITDFL